MTICNTCKDQFNTHPFLHDEDEGLFCSIDCLPVGTLDEPYAMSYAFLMDYYVELTIDAKSINNKHKQVELLDGIDELINQCAEYILGQDGMYFYKDELSELYNLAVMLYESVSKKIPSK